MQIHIINNNNQIFDIINLENKFSFETLAIDFYNEMPIGINKFYILFVNLLDEEMKKLYSCFDYCNTDDEIINNTRIQDCCKVISKLKTFLNKDFNINIIY